MSASPFPFNGTEKAMFIKLEDAVKLGVTLDGNAPYFFDHGHVVVFVPDPVKGERRAK